MNIAIVGASGAVGQELCTILKQRSFPISSIVFLSSGRSLGRMILFQGKEHQIQELTSESLEGIDLAFFCAGGDISRQFAPQTESTGTVVIDNSSAFRMDPGVPLVVPEVNLQDLRTHQGLIANPNCSAILLAMVTWPLHQNNPIQRMVVSTYQAVSGAGAAAIEELKSQTLEVLQGDTPVPSIFPHTCAFNVFSHESAVNPEGYNEEEAKMMQETRKLFHDDRLRMCATCVRVPVIRAHSQSVNITFEHPTSERDVRRIINRAPGLELVDDREANHFPMPLDATGKDDVLVGRIRVDPSDPSGRSINLFLSGDQLRKGAALNAVQIAEHLVP